MKRQRGRNRRSGGGGNNPNRHYESNGPDVKIRGSAQQVLEKYLQYARDAQTSGDRVMSEAYFQHAEHYQRLLSAMQTNKDKSRRDRNDRDDDNDNDDSADDNDNSADNDGDDDNAADDKPSRGRGGRRNRQNGADAEVEADAGDDSESGDDPLKVIDADEGDAGNDGEDNAPKPRRRRTYKKRETASDEAGDDDGVLKTLSRGRPKAEESSEASESAAE